MTAADIIAREPEQELVYQALRFAYWAAGEGIRPVDYEKVPGPEDFLFDYSKATGDEDWETLAERLASYRLVKPGYVLLPTNENEAAGMAIVGERWLKDNAPHRILAPDELDDKTIEACAKVADDEEHDFSWAGTTATHNLLAKHGAEIAAAIRKLAGEGT